MAAISTIDTLAHTNRWALLHVADKAALAGGLVLCAAVLPPWPAAPLVLAAAVVSAAVAGVPWRDLATVVRVPVAFIAVGSLAAAVSISTGPVRVGLGDAAAAAELFARAVAGSTAAVLLAMTVPVSELVARLRQLGVPAVACSVIMLMYRLLGVGLARLESRRRAQAARLGYVGFVRSLRSAAVLAGSLLLTSLDQAERLNRGLAARGLDEGDLPVLVDGARHSVGFLTASAAVLTVITVVSVAVGGPPQWT